MQEICFQSIIFFVLYEQSLDEDSVATAADAIRYWAEN